MCVAMIVMAVAEMGVTLSVLLLRSEGIAARVSLPMRILVHLELFYALGPASAALCALITQFDTSRLDFVDAPRLHCQHKRAS